VPDEERWVDLADPDEQTLRAALPVTVHDITVERLLRPSRPDHHSRPRLEARVDYVFGVLLCPAVRAHADEVCHFHEIDVVATVDRFVTVRKGDEQHAPAEFDEVRRTALRAGATPGMCLYYLVDEIAERFLDLVDRFDEEIDELEDRVPETPAEEVRMHISALRHAILDVRRVLSPTRDAARAVLDDRVELDGDVTVFPREVELHFADTYDRLLRASDNLDLARDLLAGVRDFHQAQMAMDQNEVTKRLTVVASLLLLPTFIVGVYGQNFADMPELRWRFGYHFSWIVIIVTTVLQLWYFRRKRWI
jgi:magnesium transporter